MVGSSAEAFVGYSSFKWKLAGRCFFRTHNPTQAQMIGIATFFPTKAPQMHFQSQRA